MEAAIRAHQHPLVAVTRRDARRVQVEAGRRDGGLVEVEDVFDALAVGWANLDVETGRLAALVHRTLARGPGLVCALALDRAGTGWRVTLHLPAATARGGLGDGARRGAAGPPRPGGRQRGAAAGRAGGAGPGVGGLFGDKTTSQMPGHRVEPPPQGDGPLANAGPYTPICIDGRVRPAALVRAGRCTWSSAPAREPPCTRGAATGRVGAADAPTREAGPC